MPQEIDGVTYLNVTEVAEEMKVSRQTLWRWRREGSIPAGNRYRGSEILFSPAEVDAIRRFAFGVQPIDQPAGPDQISLFQGTGGA